MDASDGQWVGYYECHGQGRNQAGDRYDCIKGLDYCRVFH